MAGNGARSSVRARVLKGSPWRSSSASRALERLARSALLTPPSSARAQVEALSDSVATAQENLDAADKGLRFARERLEAGVGSQLEVRDAALKLAQAKLTSFDTVADLTVAGADLNRAVGGSL